MPQFIYEGTGNSLSIAGRTLIRGIPATLEGRAAESAASHPDVTHVGSPGAKKASTAKAPAALAEFAAMRARAKELGLPATGKKADLAAAIEAAERRLDEDGAD